MQRIRFLHIPKTAGTSFTSCLASNYPGEAFYFTGDTSKDLERYKRLQTAEKQRISRFVGHGPRITGVEEIDTLPTVTLLRHPIRRVMSFCQHVREGKSEYLLALFPPISFDLSAFLNSGNHELSNLQTRMLLGKLNYDALPDAEPRSLVRQALEVLTDDLACFGLVAQYQESLMLIQHALRWAKVPVHETLNAKGKRRLTFTEEHIQRIRDLNSIDTQLYHAALPIFQQRIQRWTADVAPEVHQWRFSRPRIEASFYVPDWVKNLVCRPEWR